MAGILGRFISLLRTRSAKDRILSQMPYSGMYGIAPAQSGVDVTPSSSMSLSAVYAAVQAISYDVAAFPLLCYRHLPQGGKEKLNNHPVASLLRDPNPEMVEFDCRAAIMVGALLYGNGYAEIVRRGDGRAVELWPIESYRVAPMYDGQGKLFYQVDGTDFPAESIFHIKGLSASGVVGFLMTRMAKEAIGIALATQQFAATYYANNARLGLILKSKKGLSAEAQTKLRDNFSNFHGGVGNAHKVAVLEEDMDAEEIGGNAEDSQLLTSRQFSVVEVARYFGVSPIRLGELGRATWSNLEESNSAYIAQTLTPWCKKIEQTAQKRLFLPTETDLFAEHNLDALLRAKTSERYVAYGQAINAGWMTRNEVRAKENLPPLEGLDTPVMQGAMIPGDKPADKPVDPVADPINPAIPPKPENPPAPQPDPNGDQPTEDQVRSILTAQLPVLVATTQRLLRVEQDKVSRAIKRGSPADFADWARPFYQQHRKVVEESLAPVITAMVRSLPKTRFNPKPFIDLFTGWYVSDSRSDLTEEGELLQRVQGWDVRAESFAQSVLDQILSDWKSKVKHG